MVFNCFFFCCSKKKIVSFSLTIENLTLIKVLIVDKKKSKCLLFYLYVVSIIEVVYIEYWLVDKTAMISTIELFFFKLDYVTQWS